MAGALEGIRVLDLTRILAGPWATQLLADLGAEVIKIEKPEVGDDTRHWGPPYFEYSKSGSADAAYFMSANRGKKSVTLDISSQEGQKQILKLAKGSDVLIENFKVGGLKKYGLDYDSVKQVNPQIVYCSITGFGQDGPDAHKPGYDLAIQAMSGLMSITGLPESHEFGEPQRVGVAVADLFTGMYAANAIQAALLSRYRTNQGQYIDLALQDCMLACLANQNMNYLVSGKVPQRWGTAHPNIVPYQAVHAKDKPFILAVGNDSQFNRFCEIIGRAELASDNRFNTNEVRVANRDTLIELIESKLKHENSDFWLDALEKAKIPCAPINNIQQAFEQEQIKARGMLLDTGLDPDSPPMVANPIKFSSTPTTSSLKPPKLGEHNQEILGE